MNISKDEVAKVGFLARLELSEAELERYSVELSKILDHIDNLSKLDTQGVEPLARSIQLNCTPTRLDQAHNSDTIQTFRDNLHRNSPDREGQFFKVPKIKKAPGSNKAKDATITS